MSDRQLTVALLGNTNPEVFWATENEYVDAWERAGHSVFTYMEPEPSDWDRLIVAIEDGVHFDLIQWTRTKQYANQAGEERQNRLIRAAKDRGIPLIGVHLDQFLALPQREASITVDPYFRGVDVMFTTDGGHQEKWASLGVNHRWLLPGISERWLGIDEPDTERDIVFVGQWTGIYHREFRHRHVLVAHLRRRWGDRVTFLPAKDQPRIVGRDLNALYAGAKVVIGDAFHVPGRGGAPLPCTGSDRTPEVLGRGGILVTPAVDGWNQPGDPFYIPSVFTWPMWDWYTFDQTIHMALRLNDEKRQFLRERGVAAIARSHTYTHRVKEIVETLTHERML